MQRWLFKTEPSDYSLADLKNDKKSLWTGVRNAMARIHLRSVRRGDPILLYHTGSEKAIVGLMKAAANPTRDTKSDDPKGVAVEVAFTKEFTTPLTLQAIRADPEFSEFDLVRNSRLSVMPVTASQWERIVQLTGK